MSEAINPTEIANQALAQLRETGQAVNLDDLIIEAHGGPDKFADYVLDELHRGNLPSPGASDNDPDDEDDSDWAVWFAD